MTTTKASAQAGTQASAQAGTQASAQTSAQTSTQVGTRTGTGALLVGGALAAPVFGILSFGQAFTREGFDLTRHPLSMLSNGDLAWLQITTFVLMGVLAVAGSIGLRRALDGQSGGVWAPRLIGVFGVTTVLAGIFTLEPMDGFPVGTPPGVPASMSWHSLVHNASGAIGFLALIVAWFVLARHYGRAGRTGYAVGSAASGVIFLAGNVWAMSGGAAGALAVGLGSLAGIAWLTVVALDERAGLR
ncbi:hypothetical protein Acor_46940 [Acrocarpospora corrugata]|uniref:DUF998 domain-containing protein n=1 Tax=Acrocarpospora corrugata TaxID=35763 RepID=A0A5M3W7Z0_9ACTN|nr:DUF998 domain-containing protein [Acrocarpospora corrugata]GES02628.1 hypothetical protein Acor_46940 [Acrocarpospora corrugata]